MASHVPLAPDDTLRTAVARLGDKTRFIADAYGVISSYERTHGHAVLRLGVSSGSKGRRPNYCIDRAGSRHPVAAEDRFAVIDGNTHQPWPGDEMNLNGSWSEKGMTRNQVFDLLVEVCREGQA